MAATSSGKPPDKSGSIENLRICPGQVSAGTAWAVHGAPGGTEYRSFQQIIEDEKKKRNIIEIKLRLDSGVFHQSLMLFIENWYGFTKHRND